MFVADTLVVLGLATVSLGTIQEADGMQERSFWLCNAGQEDVSLCQGYTSCGCTTIDYAKNMVVAPGDSTCVTLRFNPRGKGGEFEETGTVVYGNSRKRVQLSMTGICITSEETLMSQFPIRISDGIRLSANRFDLGNMHVNETKERGVVVLHREDSDRQERIPVFFTATSEMPKGLQQIAYPIKTMENGKEVAFTITLDFILK